MYFSPICRSYLPSIIKCRRIVAIVIATGYPFPTGQVLSTDRHHPGTAVTEQQKKIELQHPTPANLQICHPGSLTVSMQYVIFPLCMRSLRSFFATDEMVTYDNYDIINIYEIVYTAVITN